MNWKTSCDKKILSAFETQSWQPLIQILFTDNQPRTELLHIFPHGVLECPQYLTRSVVSGGEHGFLLCSSSSHGNQTIWHCEPSGCSSVRWRQQLPHSRTLKSLVANYSYMLTRRNSDMLSYIGTRLAILLVAAVVYTGITLFICLVRLPISMTFIWCTYWRERNSCPTLPYFLTAATAAVLLRSSGVVGRCLHLWPHAKKRLTWWRHWSKCQ